MKTAFPDNLWTIDEILGEDNKIVVRTTMRATNTGPIVGLPMFGRLEQPVPPTGNAVTVTGLTVYTISDGRIVSAANEIDQVGLLRQPVGRLPHRTRKVRCSPASDNIISSVAICQEICNILRIAA